MRNSSYLCALLVYPLTLCVEEMREFVVEMRSKAHIYISFLAWVHIGCAAPWPTPKATNMRPEDLFTSRLARFNHRIYIVSYLATFLSVVPCFAFRRIVIHGIVAFIPQHRHTPIRCVPVVHLSCARALAPSCTVTSPGARRTIVRRPYIPIHLKSLSSSITYHPGSHPPRSSSSTMLTPPHKANIPATYVEPHLHHIST